MPRTGQPSASSICVLSEAAIEELPDEGKPNSETMLLDRQCQDQRAAR